MTIEQPLGPLFIDVADKELRADEQDRLAHPLLGGVILFARNYESTAQLVSLVREIKAVRSPPLLIAVDQEGGRVQRFKQGFTPLPAARTYGDLYDKDHDEGIAAARSAGYVMAAELRRTGIDLSFAPVLDLAQAESEVIGDRAFHREPRVVSVLARSFVEGMNRAGMKATGKHFPGHGSVSADSHTCLPCDDRGWDEIECSDLVPYRDLSAILHGVMTAHVRFSAVNGELPTYSSYWLQQVLRRQVGFQGVVFSDDLSMEGAKIQQDPMQRVKRALAAGCDMTLLCNAPDAVDLVLDNLRLDLPEATPAPVLALHGAGAEEGLYQQALTTVMRYGTG